ncbi:MAG: FKBP-type peptidyl-prolyl cis-trans isomerase [Acidiferrobacterales bacterium]
MKLISIWLLPVAALLVATAAHAATPLKTQKQKFSYAIGVKIGQNFKRQEMDLDTNAVVQAIRDVQGGKKPKLTPKQMQQAIEEYQKALMAKHKALADKNLGLALAFLEKNKKKKGVKVTTSGLQYEVLKKGGGSKPKVTDKVEVNYHGTLIDGRIFDSSVNRGQSATFPINGVIKGWQEVIPMMKKGAKWRIVIPPALAYGAQGRPGIPPNSALIFEVELIDIK